MELSVFYFALVISLSLAAPYHDDGDYYDYSSEEFDHDDQDSSVKPAFKHDSPVISTIKNDSKKSITNPTNRPVSTYEVTENVNDIPDPNPVRRPIVTNHTSGTPLNIVPANVNSNRNRSGQAIQFDYMNNVTPDDELINNPFYFGFDKETPDSEEDDLKDDHDDKDSNHSHEECHEISHVIPSIKAYFYGLKRGLINGLNTLIGRGIYKNVNSEVDEPYRRNPDLPEKLHKISHALQHSKYYGHKFDDY